MTAALPSVLDRVPTVAPSRGLAQVWEFNVGDETLHRGVWLRVHSAYEYPRQPGRIVLRLGDAGEVLVDTTPTTLRRRRVEAAPIDGQAV